MPDNAMGRSYVSEDAYFATVSNKKDMGRRIFSNHTLYIMRLKFDK